VCERVCILLPFDTLGFAHNNVCDMREREREKEREFVCVCVREREREYHIVVGRS
jgi:hypothetical protein